MAREADPLIGSWRENERARADPHAHNPLNAADERQVREALRGRSIRYALVPAFIGSAALLSALLHPLIPHSEDYLFLAAIVATAWLGRRGPGLLAALFAPFVLDYFFLPPLHTLGISPEARLYILPFLLSALAAAWMSSTLGAARETRALLEKSEEKFRRILTNQPDVAWTVDQNGRVLYISPKIKHLFGYTSEELRAGGVPFLLSRVHPAELDHLRQAILDLFSGRAGFDVEFRFQHKDGAWIWVHNRAMSTWQENGVILADGVLSDISERKAAEVELQSKTAFLEAQVNSTIDGILVVDAAGRQTLQNRRLAAIFGLPPNLIGTPDDELVLRHAVAATKNPDSFLAKVRYLYAHPDQTSRDEIELKNGTILDRYSSPVHGKEGQYYGRIWTFRDITERKRRENTLRQLSAAVEQSPVSVVITDLEGNITYTNRKFSECTGYSLEEVKGRNSRFLNSGYSPPEMYRKLWTTIRNGGEWRGEFRNRKKNGELHWESVAISPILDEHGSIASFLALKEDITERRALESELRQAQKLEGIGQLAAGVAHEINTPIQFVTDNLTFLHESWEASFRLIELYRDALHRSALPSPQLLQDLAQAELLCDFEFVRSEVPRAIAQSLDGTRRVAKIVRAIRDFSHPDLADKTETDLNEGIASTIVIARNEWKYVADLVTDLDETLPPVVCYPGDVNQVVLNLIVNAAHAIKARLKDSAKGRIVVRTRTSGSFAEISVSDTGTGVPEAIRTRIFEPFFTTKEVGSGTGQGLAFAHTVVVKKHRGKIWFDTEIGSGSTFYIHLPIHAAQEKAS
jgi:PAS domain S-box-containing protein